MEWLEKLQVPGLILAGAVIFFQYKIIMKLLTERRQQDDRVALGLAENNRVTARLTSILADLVCKRTPK